MRKKKAKWALIDSDKWGCREISAGLVAYGITTVVTSPGSRNVPLLMTVERNPELTVLPVVDERSAAFIALGIAATNNEPVAIICTSGTALLNYAPAVAEAFYRHIPLIVISADRPKEWIDQNDSQTIRQPGALASIVKGSFSIKGEAETEEQRWFVNRTINEALTTATYRCSGPVHINVELSTPLSGETEMAAPHKFRYISYECNEGTLSSSFERYISWYANSRKSILIFGSSYPPSPILTEAILSLAKLPNVVVVAEGLANLKCNNIHQSVEALFGRMSEQEARRLKPDILITFGGAPVSAAWKRQVREWHPAAHWHVDESNAIIDTYMSLSRKIAASPDVFFTKLAKLITTNIYWGPQSNYNKAWHLYAFKVKRAIAPKFGRKWNGPDIMSKILKEIPDGWNLQLGNGMSVRYALLNDLNRFNRVDSNRGVSGIDGCLSTAIGASLFHKTPTLLITGDMSFQYDMGALASMALKPKLKIIVLNNGGGGIFNFVKTTESLPERDRLLKCDSNMPIAKIARAYGMKYAPATNFMALDAGLKLLETERRPMILEVFTDADTDAKAMWTLITRPERARRKDSEEQSQENTDPGNNISFKNDNPNKTENI